MEKLKNVVIIGAGPAGLTTGYELSKNSQFNLTIIEADANYLGGISRTVRYKNFRFDIGGHRFFSKSKEIENLWSEILGSDLLERPRKSSIYYKKKFYDYPLKPFNALFQLGFTESIYCFFSYLYSQINPIKDPNTFEDWVTNLFGRRLFNIFFKSYTEKVWGIECKNISADWAKQRIKGLSILHIFFQLFRSKKTTRNEVKTLISQFRYPRLGPGMMWEKCAQKIMENGGKIVQGVFIQQIKMDVDKKSWIVTGVNSKNELYNYIADEIVLTLPLGTIASLLSHYSNLPFYPDLKKYSSSLKFRDFILVALIMKKQEEFGDNWIYIHDNGVKVGRIQNFRNWSIEMAPDLNFTCYGLEYFCQEGDTFWNKTDIEFISLASAELYKLGLIKNLENVVDGKVIRQPKAYPVYDHDYKNNIEKIRSILDENFNNLHFAGRNGMHKYNNQDHSMMTGLLVAKNIIADKKNYDVWSVNEDAEYHEIKA